MICTGIDEAGLGPILGPYCAGMVSIRHGEEYRDPRIFCDSILSAQPAKGLLAVGDSKKIYAPGKLDELEKTVLTFFKAFYGVEITTGLDFLKHLTGENLHEAAPWYGKLETFQLPLSGTLQKSDIHDYAERLKGAMASCELKVFSLALSAVPAAEFNRMLSRTSNKAVVCQKILSPLLRYAVSHSDCVVVDRQGGRRYYGDWLVELFPGRLLTAHRELKELSRYKLENCRIDFQVKADAISFETSLASMFAKYARELCMTSFNDYWREKSSDIKPTAGYYSDGQRFLKDLERRNLLPSNRDMLVRRK